MPSTAEVEDLRKSTHMQDGDEKKHRQRSGSASSSTSSIASASSITSLFESSLALLGSLPVATSSSNDRPIIHKSIKNGTFKLYLNSSAGSFEEIQLQSHLLWPSSPRLAELMEEEQNGRSIIGIKGERGMSLADKLPDTCDAISEYTASLIDLLCSYSS